MLQWRFQLCLCFFNSCIKSSALLYVVQRNCINYPPGAWIVSPSCQTSANLDAEIVLIVNYLGLEVNNCLFPSAKRPKVKKSVFRLAPASLIYFTTFAILAELWQETHSPFWLRIQTGCRLFGIETLLWLEYCRKAMRINPSSNMICSLLSLKDQGSFVLKET